MVWKFGLIVLWVAGYSFCENVHADRHCDPRDASIGRLLFKRPVESRYRRSIRIHAGRRTDFRDKNRAIFSGELFPGEELLPEKAVLGQ